MYVTNTVLRFREHNRVLEVVETYDEIKALLAAAKTAGEPHIEVTVTREDTQFLSPTPVNTRPEKKLVTAKNLVLIENLALVQPVVAPPTSF
jgi:mRNA degradation ribonuclease J1/J2